MNAIPAKKPSQPDIPTVVMMPLDVAGIGAGAIGALGGWLWGSWITALTMIMAGVASWLHMRFLVASMGKLGGGRWGAHLLWTLLRLAVLGGIITSILLLFPGNAFGVIIAVVLSATGCCFGILIGFMRLRRREGS